MSFTKADGAKIKITFDQPITDGAAGNQGHFTVTVPEYDYVPGGTLQNVTKTVKSTYAMADLNSIVLEMQPLERFESAAGNITVAYDGSGTLQGAGGPVVAFTQSFAPTDLIPKPDQNDQEHINIASIAATSNLMRVYYTNAYGNEHINIASITAVGTLTNINDL